MTLGGRRGGDMSALDRPFEGQKILFARRLMVSLGYSSKNQMISGG